MTPRCCTVPACERPVLAKAMCRIHYDRQKRHGDPSVVLKVLSPRGAPRAWLLEHASHPDGQCLIWPFARHPDGRAHMHGAKPARVMCEIVHGPAPSATHEAAHSCGNGNGGCVHPKHLRWATPSDNAADKIGHGTLIAGERHYAAKLTAADVAEIRSLRGALLQREIASRFGVNLTCVNKILNGRSWRRA